MRKQHCTQAQGLFTAGKQVTMSIQFSGWEVVDDGACFPGVMLAPAQKPQNKGVYTMFHGTSVSSARAILSGGFKQSSAGMLGKGVYMSRDVKKAAHYPLGSNPSDRVIFELRVRVGRVKRIDQDNHPMQFTWSTQGYNTAWVPPNCGMKSVPSGLEEDCVFDPKRVKVVGIAKAPNPAIKKELQQLLAKESKKDTGGAGDCKDVCQLCKRKTQKGAPHIKQQCWKCGQDICILTSKHFCQSKP
uniref:Gig2 protein DreP n=1 Tax=Fundulus heteroclitus TaxID=8078 RepID=A0A146X292_FUNHE